MAILGGDGSIILTTKIDQSGFNKGMASLKGAITKLGAAIGVAFGVRALVQFGKQAVQLASDLQEVQNVVDVAFGDMAYRMEEFAETSIETFGISKLTAKQTGSSFMAMAKGMQFADDVAADMALTLTGLSADMASFYNIRQEEARTALSAVYTGETETLKRYGILITEVNLQEFARQQGITKSINAMTQQEKTMLRYQFVLEQTRLASGDFVRTQDSWANQTRILAERWKEMQTVFGEAFMTIGVLVLPVINNIIVGLTKVAQAAQVVAQWIYKAFTGKELKSSTNATQSQATALSGVGSSAEDAADGMADLGDATEKAGKQAKKSLAAFDELTTLSSDAEKGTAVTPEVSTAGLGGAGGVSSAMSVVPEDDTQISFLNNILDRLKPIQEIFMSGFWKGFQNADFSGIKKSISGIKKSLTGIFTSPEVQNSAQGFVSSVTLAFGKIAGSIVSVGKTYAENLLGGFNLYLDGNSETIKTRISNIFDASSGIATSVGNMWTAFADIFSAFASTNGQTLTSNIIGIFSNAFLGILELTVKFGEDFINFLTQPIIDNKEVLKEALDGLLGAFSKITGQIKKLVDELVDDVLNLYDEHISPFIKTLTDVLSDWVDTFVEGYNKHIKPIIDAFADEFENLVGEHLVPMFDVVMKSVGKVIDIWNWLWDNVLRPIGKWLINNFLNVFGNVFYQIKDIVFIVIGAISDSIDSIFKIFNGLIDFIAGVFTGDWKRAWEGIKGIFKGIINGFVTIIERGVNLIISAINGIIGGVDNIVGAVGSALGLDWNIPKIPKLKLPRLAQGAVIPPNREFLAVLGDQKRGTNIEAPLDTIKQAVAEVLSQVNVGGSSGRIEVPVIIDGREVARAVREAESNMGSQTVFGGFANVY